MSDEKEIMKRREFEEENPTSRAEVELDDENIFGGTVGKSFINDEVEEIEEDTDVGDVKSTNQSETPATSFIMLDGFSVSNSGDAIFPTKILETQASCNIRDDVFQDNSDLENTKILEGTKIIKWSEKEENLSTGNCNLHGVSTTSETESEIQEKEKTTYHGKLSNDRIEQHELLQQQPTLDESKERLAIKDTFLVSKGHTKEIMEKIEKIKSTEVEGRNTDNNPSPLHQFNKRKLADNWLTVIKLSTQTTKEAKVNTTPTISKVRDAWKKREEAAGNDEQPNKSLKEANTTIKIGKLRQEGKEICGSLSNKAHRFERNVNDVSLDNSGIVKRSPSYRSHNRDNASTRNIVSYTKTGVKTDTKVNLIPSYSGYQIRSDSYRCIERYGLIEMLDDFKIRIAALEDENKRLKKTLYPDDNVDVNCQQKVHSDEHDNDV